MEGNFKKIAEEYIEKGYQNTVNAYKKFNEKTDKVLSTILDEKADEKFGIFDLARWIKNKFKKANKKIEMKDEELLEENKNIDKK